MIAVDTLCGGYIRINIQGTGTDVLTEYGCLTHRILSDMLNDGISYTDAIDVILDEVKVALEEGVANG